METILIIIFSGIVGGLYSYTRDKNLSSMKRFILGWGSSTISVLIVIIISLFMDPDSSYKLRNIYMYYLPFFPPILIGIIFSLGPDMTE